MFDSLNLKVIFVDFDFVCTYVAGLIHPVTLSGDDITTESTTEVTTTHKQMSFSTSGVLLDKTTGSIRSTNRKSTYSLVPSTSLKLDQTTYAKTTNSAQEGLTIYNSTLTG